ncbi:MAG: response regulator transcription factor [Eggerthellaceae bacterium]|jgi:two-component system OmpR family response regulator
MQILMVEDDERLSSALKRILEENNYQVDAVFDGESGLEYGKSEIYDVIILDVMLPKMDGFHVAQALRRENVDTPILLLTARSTIPDKIEGLDSGADDYMTKPFSAAEILAHLRALTRRKNQVIYEKLEYGDLSLNLESHDLTCGSKSITLSYKEFELAEILLANSEQIVSKEMLISKVWGFDSSAVDNNVEAYISFLRKKLKFLHSETQIETIRKLGYRLVYR